MNVADTIAALRRAADELAVDVALWAARDPHDLSREALAARNSAITTIDETMEQLRLLRRELAPGAHRVRGRHC